MATVAELAARTHQEVGYLLVIEGYPIAFTNRGELTGTGPSSWIGQDAAEDEREVVLGLQPPESVKLAIGIVDSGMLVDDGVTFTLTDRDGHIVALALDEPGELMYERLAPTDDPAPASVLGPGGSAVVLHDGSTGRHVNGEALGPDGERRQFQILPGGTLPGLDHAAIDVDAGRADLRASTVRDEARWLEGRPCALYLIRRDDDGSWPAWSDQYDSGYSLIWWGTCKGLSAKGHMWRLECEGPSSWLRRTLNVTAPAEFRPLFPLLELDSGQDKIAVSFFYRDAVGGLPVRCGTSAYDPVDDVITSGQTPAELAVEINARLQTLAATAGVDDTFADRQAGSVEFTDEQFKIRVADNNGGSAEGGVCKLRMHKLAWLHLGWDLAFEVQGRGSLNDLASVYEVLAEGGSSFKSPDFEAPDPASGYVTANFTTWPLGIGDGADSPWSVDGDGGDRAYKPIYPGGGVALLKSTAQQEWDAGFGVDAPYLTGQLAKPPPDATIGSGTCDAGGFFVVRGSRRQEVDGEVETVYQVARVGWVNDDNRVAIDPESRAVVWCHEWLDPAAWGSASERLEGAWAANDLEWAPLAVLGYNTDTPDHAHRVLARLLLSTGTAAWSGVGDAATITSGDNAHPDAGGGKADDQEIADLGLGIPAAMVDILSMRAAAEALPGGIDGGMNRTRLAYVGPFDSQQTIEDILRPRGWCFSLRGGRYGLFARNAPLDIADLDVAITQADVAGEVDALPPAESADFRPLEPVDLISVTYGKSLIGGDGRERTVTIKARDPRASSRRGNARVEIEGTSLTADGAWLLDFSQLWGEQLARFYGEPKALVTVAVKGDKARDLWPGSVVTYTSPWPATRSGSYGMTSRLGRVVSVERDLKSLAARLEILVDAGDPIAPRRFAPIARLVDSTTTVEARHDAANRKLYCYADAFGRGTARKDVTAFAEPWWSTAGGTIAAAVLHSWDGVTWEATALLDIESVDASDNSITYSVGGLVGEIWEDRFGVIVPRAWDDQSADEWPRAIFAPLCGTDNKHSTGDQDGYPWAE